MLPKTQRLKTRFPKTTARILLGQNLAQPETNWTHTTEPANTEPKTINRHS
jgi:hypothetical protein